MGIYFRFPFFLYLYAVKVRVYPLSESHSDYYFERYLEPNYNMKGELLGYTYDTDGWYGAEIFKRDINNGIIKIITDIEPKYELKKFSLL